MSTSVMVVDDSRIVFAQIKKMLQDTDFEIVQYCQSGESALEAYGNCNPDIVTMDIIMPGMDGFETAKKILEKWPDAKIIMVSSLAYDETIAEAAALGLKDFIYKPLQRDKIIEALTKAVQ